MAQDWIEREIMIDASRERVWAVLTSADQVVRWFGDSAEIDLRPGGQAAFGWTEHGVFQAVVEQVDPPSLFAYRWARDPGAEPVAGLSTLVEFTITEVPTGTLLRVVETGFASLAVSPADQARAASDNTQGWTDELAELKQYAERPTA